MAERLQQPSGARYRSAAVRVVKEILAIRPVEHSDAQPAWVGPDLLGQRTRPRWGVVRLAGEPGTDPIQHAAASLTERVTAPSRRKNVRTFPEHCDG
jgi:hypothetical protein